MIYAIEAIGTEYVKFGKATRVRKRLPELQIGCPHELGIKAIAVWPDPTETAIHKLLQPHNIRGEWYTLNKDSKRIIDWMLNRDFGLQRFQIEVERVLGDLDLAHACAWGEKEKRSAEVVRRAERRAWWHSRRGQPSPLLQRHNRSAA